MLSYFLANATEERELYLARDAAQSHARPPLPDGFDELDACKWPLCRVYLKQESFLHAPKQSTANAPSCHES